MNIFNKREVVALKVFAGFFISLFILAVVTSTFPDMLEDGNVLYGIGLSIAGCSVSLFRYYAVRD